METAGIEHATSRMQSEHSTAELSPLLSRGTPDWPPILLKFESTPNREKEEISF